MNVVIILHICFLVKIVIVEKQMVFSVSFGDSYA